MSRPIPASMVRLRNQIRDAETKADQALIAKTELMRSILLYRQTEEVPAPHTGQDAIIRLGRAIQNDISSAGDLFRTHNCLTTAKTEIMGPGHEDTLKFATEAEMDETAAA